MYDTATDRGVRDREASDYPMYLQCEGTPCLTQKLFVTSHVQVTYALVSLKKFYVCEGYMLRVGL